MRTIAIANHKGGVGKTTTVINIGAILANKGYKTLLIDLDAQANLTDSVANIAEEQLTEEEKDGRLTIYNALKKGGELPVYKLTESLYIAPSSLELATIELELSSQMRREYRLKDLLEPLKNQYDYILLDCSPSLGLVTINALAACTEVYIPVTAEALPTRGLKMLQDVISQAKQLNPALRLGGIIITRWEKSKLSQNIEETLRATYGEIVFNTKIRKNISVAEAPLYAEDIVKYAPTSNGAKDYLELAEEIISRTQKEENAYRLERNGKELTLWNDTEQVGLHFTEGEKFQRYTAKVIIKDTQALGTEQGQRHLNQIIEELKDEAGRRFPKEIEPPVLTLNQ